MTSAHQPDPHEISSTGLPSGDVPRSADAIAIDGRHLKRQRNIENVRNAIVELLGEGVTPTLALAARRAGVTTRSIYRYFGDIDSAIAEAIAARCDLVLQVFGSEPPISTGSPFAERAALLALRRLRLQELIAPIEGRDTIDGLAEMLDKEVADTFARELADHVGDDRIELLALLCAVFRLGAVAAAFDSFENDPGRAVRGMCRLAASLLSNRASAADAL